MSNKLPPECYALLPGYGTLVRIVRGESGYYPMKRDGEAIRGEEAIEVMNFMNADLGVNVAQREAMQHGSMWGWDCPAADPDCDINQAMMEHETNGQTA